MSILKPGFSGSLIVGTVLALLQTTHGWEFKGIDMHGSASVTSAYSDKYNYLGDTKKRFDTNVIEGIFNAQYRTSFDLRVAAQVYVYQLDDSTAFDLDYANLTYSFTDWFGVSIGRNKRPLGLFYEIQDIDVVHPFAFLPLANLRKDARAIFAHVDGIQLFGTIDFGKGGSLDYKVYGGYNGEVDPNAYFFRTISVLTKAESLLPGFQYGGSLFYNTPIQGLRFGASATVLPNVENPGKFRKKKEIRYQKTDSRTLGDDTDAQFNAALAATGLTPQMIDFLYGEDYSLWDSTIAGERLMLDLHVTQMRLSAEYVKDPFQFAVEYTRDIYDIEQSGAATGSYKTVGDGILVMATWKATPKLELGVYGDFQWPDEHDRSGKKLKTLPSHTAYTYDYAVAAAYKITDWWTIKAEYHLIDGTSMLTNTGKENGDPGDWTSRWNYLVLKSTISF